MAANDIFGIVGTTQAGNFNVERVVAEGGFGVVYRAQHGAFRAPVAIKCLKIPEAMTKQQRAVFLEKFREEAELMFRLSAAITEVVRPLHVDVLQLGDGRFVPFLALEWLEGESLDGIITRRREQGQAPLGLHKVVKMLRPVASALSRAHRFPGPQGAIAIIHRDLKPENIFVANIGGTESMKILDFGIAKAKRAASQAVGRVTGRTLQEDESASFTPAYGAPEQWSPKTYGETGPWTDVWGLALCLVEALCGTPPIDGDTYVMRRTCLDEKRRPTPRNLGADVPAEIEKVFEKALAVDPRKRFKEIESFWTELEMAMGLEPSLRKADARREPEPGGAAAEMALPALTATGARLARIELAQVPAIQAAAPVRIVGEPASARADSRAEPPASSRRARNEAPASSKPGAGRDEDWSSLGLGDSPASAAPSSPRKAPMSRKHSVGLELPLPMRATPELENSLPIQGESAPRSGGPVRRSSGELELSLPTHADGMPPPALSGAVELALPTADAPPEPAGYDGGRPPMPPGPAGAERRKHSGELELSLPTMAAAPPETASRDDDGPIAFQLNVPEPAAPAPAAPQAERLADPALRSSSDANPAVRRPEPVRPLAAPTLNITHHTPTLGERLKAPLALLLVGLVLGVVDVIYLKTQGNPVLLGPVRLSWIAAPFALVGVGLLLWRLIGVHEDE